MPGASDLPPLSEGQELSASWLNSLRDLVLASAKVTADAGLHLSRGPFGIGLALIEDRDLTIEITHVGTAGAYSWKEALAGSGGTWVDGVRVGYHATDPGKPGGTPADPAIEISGNDALEVGYRARAWRDKSNRALYFQGSNCTDEEEGG